MSEINIFPAEISDGLGEAIASNTSLAYITKLESMEDSGGFNSVTEAQLEALAAHIGERPERDTYDLYPVKTILVSTGWNGNDDIFSAEATWAARHSPEDKPFNLGHKPRDIIGHITGNVAVDADLNVIPETTMASDLPDKFHVVTSAVIYRHLGKRDPDLTEEAAEIIAGIQNGDWFVSMECLFNGFDYGFRDPATGRLEKVIARQESTAFLTKHLRMYKGSGMYNGYSIGRVLKNITFVGKGLVEVPANPESEFIFNDISAFAGQLATAEQASEILTITQSEEENTSMADDTRIRELETQLAEAKAKIEEFAANQIQANLDAKDADIASRDETIASLNTQVTELTEQVEAAKAAKTEVDEALAAKTEELEAATTKLGEIAAEATKVERVSTLVDKGLEKDKAEEIVAQFAELDDEKFAAVAALVEVPATETENTEASEETEETEESTEASEESTEETEASQDEEALENAEEETTPDLAAASDDSDDTEEAQAQLGSFIGNILSKGRTKS
jgi:hypothetical protein